MRVVIDTNLILRSVSSKSSLHWLYQAMFSGQFTLCVTTDILEEYSEIIEWGFRSHDVADAVLEALINSPFVEQVSVYFFWWLITVDPDDNKFVDCAIAAGADCIVTEDGHFNILSAIDFPKVKVIDLDTFKNLLQSGS